MDTLKSILYEVVVVICLIFLAHAFTGYLTETTWTTIGREYQEAPEVLVTREGLPVQYQGHEILLEKIEHKILATSIWGTASVEEIHLSVDGKPVLLAPGSGLDDYEGGVITMITSPRFAFYLADKEKLFVKRVSRDRTEIVWTDTDWRAEQPQQGKEKVATVSAVK